MCYCVLYCSDDLSTSTSTEARYCRQRDCHIGTVVTCNSGYHFSYGTSIKSIECETNGSWNSTLTGYLGRYTQILNYFETWVIFVFWNLSTKAGHICVLEFINKSPKAYNSLLDWLQSVQKCNHLNECQQY